jgi:hypothetical protein
MQVTIEEAYAEPVARKKRKDRAFTIGIILGIVVGVIATLLLNRAAEDDPMLDEEPVVELQPAMAPRGEQPTAPIATPEATA